MPYSLTDRRDELFAEIAALANEIAGLDALCEQIDTCNYPDDPIAWRAWLSLWANGTRPDALRPPWHLDDVTDAIARLIKFRESQLADASRELEEIEDEIPYEAAEFRRDYWAAVML